MSAATMSSEPEREVVLPSFTGKMRKKSTKINQWGDRYFSLRNGILSYYLKKSDTEPKGQLALDRYCTVSEIRSDQHKYGAQYVFRVTWHADQNPAQISEAKKSKPRSLFSTTNLAIILFGILAGSFTSGLALLVSMVLLGGVLNADDKPNLGLHEAEQSVLLACESYQDAESWVAVFEQTIRLMKDGKSAEDSETKKLDKLPVEAKLVATEEWFKHSSWKFSSVEGGVRIFELVEKSKESSEKENPGTKGKSEVGTVDSNLKVLRIDVGVSALPTDVLKTIVNMPRSCKNGYIKEMSILDSLDNSSDVVHILLDSFFAFPTRTTPRDLCLQRCWKETADGGYIMCLDSTLHHDCPLTPGYIRAELHGVFVITPCKDGEYDEDNSCSLLTFFGQMDPKGWITPKFNYADKFMKQFLLHTLEFRDHWENERFVQAYFDSYVEERKSAHQGNSSSARAADAVSAAETQGSIATIPPPLLSPEVWRDIDARNFKVRGPTYNVDKVKSVSAPSLLKLIGIDLYEVPEPTQNVCAHPRNRVNLALQRGEKSWVFVMNIMVPGPPFLCFVVYMQGDKELIEQDTPFGRIAKRFFNGNDDEFRNNRFKLIPKVVDGNMMIKMAVKDTPALLGNKLKQYYHKGDNYFEVDVDVGSSSIARNVVGLAIGYSKAIVVDMAICLQGDEENELPEVILGGCSCIHVDMSKAKKL